MESRAFGTAIDDWIDIELLVVSVKGLSIQPLNAVELRWHATHHSSH
jgi:hypothetical protein